MNRYVTGKMMIKPAYTGTASKNALERFTVGVERNVENDNLVALLRVDLLQQFGIAFDAGNNDCVARRRQPQLQERAQAIGITVKDVVEFCQ